MASSAFIVSMLPGALVADRKICGENFNGKILNACTFTNVDLRGSDFIGASLNGATFDKCNLRGVNFTDASMRGVIMKNCDIAGCDFTNADTAGILKENMHDVEQVVPIPDSPQPIKKRIKLASISWEGTWRSAELGEFTLQKNEEGTMCDAAGNIKGEVFDNCFNGKYVTNGMAYGFAIYLRDENTFSGTYNGHFNGKRKCSGQRV